MKAFLGSAWVGLAVLAAGCSQEPAAGPAVATPDTAAVAEPADLVACLEGIRGDRMSEQARGAVEMVGRHLTGQMEITFNRDEDTGAYYPSFHSNTCPVPGLHPDVQAENDRRNQARLAEVVKVLRPLADADGSGFVSTAEGQDFRQVYEFGLKAGCISAREGDDPEGLCHACRVSPAVMDSLVTRFNGLAAEAAAAGIAEISPVEWTAPQTGQAGCPSTCPGHALGRKM